MIGDTVNRGSAYGRCRRFQKFPPDINDAASSAGGQARAGGSAHSGADIALPFGCSEVAGNARARLLDEIGARDEKAAQAVVAAGQQYGALRREGKRGELAGVPKLGDCHAGRDDEQSDASVRAASGGQAAVVDYHKRYRLGARGRGPRA